MSDGGGRGRRYLKRLGADEARRLLFERMHALVPHRASESVPTPEALGRVTAAAVGAHHPAPFYHSSAMDGVALAAERTYSASETSPVRLVVPGDAVWVDTGDPIPEGWEPIEQIRDGDAVYRHARRSPEEMAAYAAVKP